MRRAAVWLLIVGLFAVAARGEEAVVYRGQTAAQWLKQLSHPSPSARAAAAQAFTKIGQRNEDAVAPLIALLSDRDKRVRFYAAYALGKFDVCPEPRIAALIKALSDADEHARYAAQWSLVQTARSSAESIDGDAPTAEAFERLLVEAETHLLASGALPGHLNSIRTAIARFQQPAQQLAAMEPPAVDSNDQDDPTARVLKQLAADDMLTQLQGIEALSKRGPEGVQELLAAPGAIASLGPMQWYLSEAIAGLGEPVLPVLTEALRHPDEEVRSLAAAALVQMRGTASAALPDVIELLEDDKTPEAVRQSCVRILAEMGDSAKPATDLLIRILEDAAADETLQSSAAEALGAIAPDAMRAIAVLLDRLHHSDTSPWVRAEIASALVRIEPKSEEVTRALVEAFHQAESTYAAIEIAEELCRCGPGAGEIVPRLIGVMDETSYDQRAAVLRILGQLGAPRADELGPLIFARLMDPNEALMVRVAAAEALGKLGPAGVQLLVEALKSGDEAKRMTAVRSLVEIGAAALPAKDSLYQMLTDAHAESELRALAAVALGQLEDGTSDAASALTELLLDTQCDSYLRSMCAVALAQINPAAVPMLETALDDPQAEVQIAAAYALCKRDPRHAAGMARLVHWLASDQYRRQAIDALTDIGEDALGHVVERMNDAQQSRDTRLACIEILAAFDERAIPVLLLALNDEVLAEDAGWALRDRGNKLVPTLLASVEDTVRFTPEARAVIGNVIVDVFSGLGGGDEEGTWQGGHPLVRRSDADASEMAEGGGGAREGASEGAGDLRSAAVARSGDRPQPKSAMGPEAIEAPSMPEDIDRAEPEAEFAETLPVPAGYKTVDVFYGTNRRAIDNGPPEIRSRQRWFWLIAIGIFAAIIVYLVTLYRRGARRRAAAGLAATTLALLLGLLLLAPAARRQSIDKPGPKYGGEYSERIEMGICQVSIPEIHQEGELEAPSLLRLEVAEDLQKHIVLRRVQRLDGDAFFTSLRSELKNQRNSILVFIHGYNVSFEDAARRTAQMSSDLKLAGAAVFYSWPSQADWWKYRVDEKNVELSVDPLKEFLLALARDSGADAINLIAHSMGNRALTDALKEIDVAASEREQLFNQVILAAPDIDADIFKQRIAPAIVTKAKHFTLYASSKDLALVASRTFNSGDPRAGDAGERLVVVPGIETIDVSSGDSSLLGHSYYGDNVSVLQDIEFLLRGQPASSRRFLEPVSAQDDVSYWIFNPRRIAQTVEPTR